MSLMQFLGVSKLWLQWCFQEHRAHAFKCEVHLVSF